MRYLEAESVGSRVESMGVCVKLKTVTEIRWSSACDTFIAASAYLVPNSWQVGSICMALAMCLLH